MKNKENRSKGDGRRHESGSVETAEQKFALVKQTN